MAEPFPESPNAAVLEEHWLRAPLELRCWAIEQTIAWFRACLPLGNDPSGYNPNLREADAAELLWRVSRQTPLTPPLIEDRDLEGENEWYEWPQMDAEALAASLGEPSKRKSWRTDRGLE